MAQSEHLLINRHSALQQWLRARWITLGLKQAREADQKLRRINMLGTAGLLLDRQRAFCQRPCSRKIPLVLKNGGEVSEHERREGMLGAEGLLEDRVHTLQQRPGLPWATLVPQQQG